MKKHNSKRSVGTSCSTSQSVAGMAIKKLSCELELRELGKKPKITSHDHRRKVQQHIADGTSLLEYTHALIDYKSNSAVIKKSLMTRQAAATKNSALKGSGFGWALVDH